jgi:hypothetical protein
MTSDAVERSKPADILGAQAFCALIGIAFAYWAILLSGSTRVLLGLFAVLYLVLVWGIERRASWARWTAVALFTMNAFGTLMGLLGQSGASANVPPAIMAVQAAVGFLCVAVVLRLAFGVRAKSYFAKALRSSLPT